MNRHPPAQRRPAVSVNRSGSRHARDDGSYAVELAVGWGIFALAVAILALAAQVQQARDAVSTAAREAARTATLATTATDAETSARTTALTLLDHAGCHGEPAVDVDVRDFRPGGYVTVTTRCRLDPLLGPTRTVTASSDEVVDRYRGGLRDTP